MKKLWLVGVLLALVVALSACGGTAQPNKATWDNSKWDSSLWQ